MFATYLHLVFLALHIHVYAITPVCQQRYIRRLGGYRCVSLEGSEDVQINEIQTQRCNYECMRRTKCTAANYNVLENTCLVNEAKCTGLKLDPAFEIMYFGGMMTTTTCLSWVSEGEFDIAKAVTADRCYKDNNADYPCYVGRLVGGDNILPAAFVPALNTQFSVFNGDKYTDGEGQVLQVQPECDEIWTIFNAGTDPFPPGAVMAGYLTETGSHLYVVKAIASSGGWRVFGYYQPATSLGYYWFTDAAQSTSRMAILVLL